MQFSSACLYHKMFHDFHLCCFLPSTVSLQILFINREIVPDPSTTLTYARTRCKNPLFFAAMLSSGKLHRRKKTRT